MGYAQRRTQWQTLCAHIAIAESGALAWGRGGRVPLQGDDDGGASKRPRDDSDDGARPPSPKRGRGGGGGGAGGEPGGAPPRARQQRRGVVVAVRPPCPAARPASVSTHEALRSPGTGDLHGDMHPGHPACLHPSLPEW
jgi:hypothetical protein